MPLQEHHDILHAALLLPCLHDAARTHFTDAVDIQNPQRLFGQDSQSIETERRHQSCRTDVDHPAAEGNGLRSRLLESELTSDRSL